MPHFNLLENSVSLIISPCAFMNYLLSPASFSELPAELSYTKPLLNKKRGHCELQMVWHLENRRFLSN